MRLFVELLHFVNIFTAAVVSGGQVAVLLVIVPIKRALTARESVQLHLALLGHQIDRYMKPTATISALLGLTLLAIPSEHTRGRVVPLIAGLLGTLSIVITSEFFNLPTNRRMAKWSMDALPEDYDRIRNRWDRIHAIRTICGLVALAGYLVSGLAH